MKKVILWLFSLSAIDNYSIVGGSVGEAGSAMRALANEVSKVLNSSGNAQKAATALGRALGYMPTVRLKIGPASIAVSGRTASTTAKAAITTLKKKEKPSAVSVQDLLKLFEQAQSARNAIAAQRTLRGGDMLFKTFQLRR